MKVRGLVIIFILTFVIPIFAKSENLKTLESDKKKLIKEITQVQKLISTKERNYQKTLSQINVLSSQIKKISSIIEKIDLDLQNIDQQIDKKAIVITKLHQDLEKLKKEYADSLWSTYKVKIKFEGIPYVLYADKHQEYSKKLSSFKLYIKYRTKHIIQIKENYQKLSLEKTRFEEYRKIQSDLLNSRKKEVKDLETLRAAHSKLSEKLQIEKNALSGELDKKRQNVAKLNGAINKIIQDNIAKERARKVEQAKKAREQKDLNSKKGLKNFNNEDYEANIKLGNSFAATKGKLNWPVAKGVVTGKFGTHTHPELKNVQICNLGVNIQTEGGAEVKCVFAGKVVSIMRMPGMQNVVIVAHGNYHTVYVMLDQVSVSEGKTVNSGEVIGKSGKESSEIQFQIWENGVKVDPEVWLKK